MNQLEQINEMNEALNIAGPVVKRNKNEKTISVRWTFDRYSIPVKLILSYDDWLSLEKRYLSKGRVRFKDIPYISRPKKENIDALQAYAIEDPFGFSWDVYRYSQEANTKNPRSYLHRKPRGGSPYNLDRKKMEQLKRDAHIFYAFLSYWTDKPPDSYPSELQDFLNGRCLPKGREKIFDIIQKVLSKKFDIDLSAIDPYNFYNNHFNPINLDLIRKHLERTSYIPAINKYTKEYTPVHSILIDCLKVKVDF